jgi:hypothetical protein
LTQKNIHKSLVKYEDQEGSVFDVTGHLFKFKEVAVNVDYRAFCGAVAVVFRERSFEMLVCMIESRDSMTAL